MCFYVYVPQSIHARDVLHECLQKPPSARTDEDIDTIADSMQYLEVTSLHCAINVFPMGNVTTEMYRFCLFETFRSFTHLNSFVVVDI
jgi:hypothetical protein